MKITSRRIELGKTQVGAACEGLTPASEAKHAESLR